MPRRPTFTEDEIIAMRDSLLTPGRDVEPWDVYAALGQRGKFSRVKSILEANPPQVEDQDLPPKPLAIAQLPEEIRARVGEIGAEFVQKAIEVISDGVIAVREEQAAHEAALRDAHHAQMQSAARELQRFEERAAQLADLVCSLESSIDELEKRCADQESEIEDLRAQRDRVTSDVASLSEAHESLEEDRRRIANERDAAIAEVDSVRTERDRLVEENARLGAELSRTVDKAEHSDPQSAAQRGPDRARRSKSQTAPKAAPVRPAKRSAAADTPAASATPDMEVDSGCASDTWRDPAEPPLPGFAVHDASQRQPPG